MGGTTKAAGSANLRFHYNLAIKRPEIVPAEGKVFHLLRSCSDHVAENRKECRLSDIQMVRLLFSFLLLSTFAWGAGVQQSLLEQAVENWLGERDHWAFTQRAVEYENNQPRERLERYDPSREGNDRWTLLAINGRTPTAEEHAAWAKKKFRKNRRRIDTPIGDFFDFNDARLVSETDKVVRYEVPLRRDKNWLFQTDKVNVVVSVNRETQALEHLTASVREPVKVLLGLAKITTGKVDLSFLNFDQDAVPGPESAQPTGSARVSVYKFGEKVEFTWSDFKRVSPVGMASASMGRSNPGLR